MTSQYDERWIPVDFMEETEFITLLGSEKKKMALNYGLVNHTFNFRVECTGRKGDLWSNETPVYLHNCLWFVSSGARSKGLPFTVLRQAKDKGQSAP